MYQPIQKSAHTWGIEQALDKPEYPETLYNREICEETVCVLVEELRS